MDLPFIGISQATPGPQPSCAISCRDFPYSLGPRPPQACTLSFSLVSVILQAFFSSEGPGGCLTDALQHDGDSDVRKEAAISLGELNARDAQLALRQAAREDRDSGVRKAALKSAQKIKSANGIQP